MNMIASLLLTQKRSKRLVEHSSSHESNSQLMSIARRKPRCLLIPSTERASAPNNLDFIRILMAMLVVWSHCFALYLGSERTEPLSVLMAGTFNSGNLGVYVFFVISGFLITKSFQRSKSYWSFLLKRIARIYPGYLAAVCLCAFIIVPIYSATAVYRPGTVAKTIYLNLLLRGYFIDSMPFRHNPGYALNGSLWSIPYEFWCYLGVLITGIFGFLRPKWRSLLLGSFVIVILVHAWLEITGRKPGGGVVGLVIGWPYLWFKMLPAFQAGMLVHQYRNVIPRSSWIATGCVLALIVTANAPIASTWKSAVMGILLPTAVAYVVFYFAFSRQLIDAARYGDFSYGTYLYAFPIQQMLIAQFGMKMPFWLFVPSAEVLSIGAGMASWYIVERWFSVSFRKREPENTKPQKESTASPSAVVSAPS